MGSIFKAYDIRGIYGEQLTDDLAFQIGRAMVTFLNCKKVIIGYDMRPHSTPLFAALARGINLQGADVIELGLVSTPMTYFANGSLEADASVMITASHNTGEWNGFKICREKAIPLSGPTGIYELENIIKNRAFAPEAKQPGVIFQHDIIPGYTEHIHSLADIRRPIKIAVDFANAMGVVESRALAGLVEIAPLFDTIDGTFPNHEANPLKTETLADLQKMVRAGKYDFGVAFDGDADRAGFVDEKGNIIPMDIATALIAEAMLKKEKGRVFYDLRSSWAVRETIEQSGGEALQSRVGHAFIKQQIREANALFAGELSGHYYFRENYFTESSALAVLFVANLVSQSNKPISELVKPIQRYFASGEINSEVHDPDAVFHSLRARYADAKIGTLDGVSFEFADWWFNVRPSNTEPLIRLNLEAKTQAHMEKMRDEVLAIIRADYTTPDADWQESLQALQQEINAIESPDATIKDRLSRLKQTVDNSLTSDETNGHLLPTLRAAAEQFEVSHPRLTAAINTVLTTLSDAGI